MKTIVTFVFALILTISVSAQSWVGFSRSEPAHSEINVLTSNNQEVIVEVSVAGIYTLDTLINGTAYRRLILPGGGLPKTAQIGHPELQNLFYKFAAPICDDTDVSVNVVSRQTLPNCLVYPVPEINYIDNGQGVIEMEEVFHFDVNAYNTPRGNEPLAFVYSDGQIRDQRYKEVSFNPFEYDPQSQTLSVVDKLEITLSFINPTGNIQVNTGIFNKVVAGALLNYKDTGVSALINDKAFERPGFVPGNIDWITISPDTSVACQIVADYLIICADDFYDPLDTLSQVLKLAEHRAFYNGFDIAIVNVEDILGADFYYEGNTYDPYGDPDEYKTEQQIRTFIRRVYEGGNANNTGDGRLGYVLLVGDVADSLENAMLPTAYDHPYINGWDSQIIPSDYYFSCIKKNSSGAYSEDGVLFMGRFSVQNEEHLENMVEKTLFFEQEYTFDNWRNSVGFTTERIMYDDPICNISTNNYYISLLNNGWDYSIVDSYELNHDVNLIRSLSLDYMNDGVIFSQIYGGNGDINSGNSLYKPIYETGLNNYDKPAFFSTITIVGGDFTFDECLGEFLTRFSPTKGAVGFFGPSDRIGYSNFSVPIITDEFMSLQHIIPKCLFNDTISISVAGELLLTSKMLNVNGGWYPYGLTQAKFAMTLLGDPALNIFATGYQITQDATITCPTVINFPLPVRNNATITIPENCTLTFSDRGSLIIEKDGNLVIEDNAEINVDPSGVNNSITIAGGGLSVGTGVTFSDFEGGLILKSNQDVYFDKNIQYDFDGVTFNNTDVIHSNSRLVVSNSTFSNSDLSTTSSHSTIDDCIFVQSSVVSEQMGFLSPTLLDRPGMSVYNNNFVGIDKNTALQINGSSRTSITDNEIQGYEKGISMHNCGFSLYQVPIGPPIINDEIHNNTIYECGIGMELYNVIADLKANQIYDNHRGVALYNNSYTAFNNDVTPVLTPQIIRDNDELEFYISQNSFPVMFQYNQIIDEDNLGKQYDDCLLFWDVSLSPRDPVPTPQYIDNNYWGEHFDPYDDLYPYDYLIWDPVWKPKSSTRTAVDIYNEGLQYFANEDFVDAEASFIELIEEHAQTNFARAAMHELYALRQSTDFNFDGLKNYYSTFTESDSTLYETAQFLATRCNIKLKEWQPAIDWYENRIENPPSYPDSVFAVIDLGDIYLMIESDDMELKSKELIFSRFPELKPKSKVTFESTKSALLATLPQKQTLKPTPPIAVGNEKGYLGQNIPNPARVSTTVEYAIYIDGNVEIKLFNALGQLVETFSEGAKEAGIYSIEIPLSKIPEGFYHYALYINGERVGAKTLVRN